jgi:hypothetical protein
MEQETPGKALFSAVYSISKNPKQSLSRITGILSSRSGDIKVRIKMLLDCGCSTNLMGATTAKRLFVNQLGNADHIKLYNASGKRMLVLGQAEIVVEIPEMKRKETLNCLITIDLPETEQILIGIDALKQLRLLPYNWPHDLNFPSLETSSKKPRTKPSREQALLIKANRVEDKDIEEEMWHNIVTIEDIPRLKKLLENVQKCIGKNRSIFSHKLNKERVFKCKPIKLHLRKDAILPPPCTSAQRVPAHWAGKSKEIIDSYMNKGLIKRVTRPTLVCSPSFFVPKPHDRPEPRLIINYKPVNNEVLHPHHPSSTPEAC